MFLIRNNSDTISKESIFFKRINWIVIILMSIILLILLIHPEEVLDIGFFRFCFIIVNSIFCLILYHIKLRKISKILLIFNFPFFLIIFPTLFGYIIDEFFFWYPYAPTAASIMVHFVANRKSEPILYYGGLFYNLILILIIVNLLFIFSQHELEIISIVKDNFFYYHLTAICIYIFMNLTLFYLFRINNIHENKLTKQRGELQNQNEELKAQGEELNNKNHELDLTLNQLKEAQAQLVQSEKMASLGTLIAGIAHEINNPLNFISGSLEAIKSILDNAMKQCKEMSDEERNYHFKQMNELLSHSFTGVNRVSTIMKSLSTFSRKGEPKLVNSDINNLIDSTLLMLRLKIPANIEIEKKYSKIPLFYCYEDQIHQVLLNITDNAIYEIKNNDRKNDEKIIFETCTEVIDEIQYAVIKISNTGSTIPDEIINKIFDPFFTTKDTGKGTGLGLSICYTIIKEHNGFITINNNDNMVTFEIKIPVQS